MLKDNFNSDGYIRREKEVKRYKVNIISLALALPYVVITVFVFLFANIRRLQYEDYNTVLSMVVVLIVFFLFVVAHELIHGIVSATGCEKGFKSITFGMTGMNPSCHCNEIIPIKTYKISLVMPLIITGIIPYIISVIINNPYLALISILSIVGASADMYSLILLSEEKNDSIVEDYEKQLGCAVYEKKSCNTI